MSNKPERRAPSVHPEFGTSSAHGTYGSGHSTPPQEKEEEEVQIFRDKELCGLCVTATR